jgi:multiple sugar transport system substrate-binding protein
MMRKTILILTLAAIILSGCAAVPAPPPGNANVSLMIFGDPAEKAAFESLIGEFERDNPRITVELTTIPSQSDFRKRLAADFAAGAPPDVFLINYRRYAEIAAKGVLEPLGAYFDASAQLKAADFYPEALAAFTWQGHLTCVPQNVASLNVYYNKDLFDQAGLAYPKAGWTWDGFLETAQALTKDTDGDGAPDQFGLGTTVETIRLAPFIWQNGGSLVDDGAAPTRLTLDTPEAKEAFQWFVDLQVKHRVVPNAAEESAESSESRFQNGRLGMFLQSRRVVPTLRDIAALNWDVAALPVRTQAATVLHADAYCLSAAAKDKQAAWSFIEFANSIMGQTTIAETGRTVPSLRAVAESPAFLDPNAKPQGSQVFLDVIPTIRTVPVMPAWPAIEDALTAEIQRAYYGQASVDEAIRSANEITQQYFAR